MDSERERFNAVNNRHLPASPAESSPHIAVAIQSSMIRNPRPSWRVSTRASPLCFSTPAPNRKWTYSRATSPAIAAMAAYVFCGFRVLAGTGPDRAGDCVVHAKRTALNVLAKIMQSNHMVQFRMYQASS
jgi:hypothetical protein